MLPTTRNWLVHTVIAGALVVAGSSCTRIPHSPNSAETTVAYRAEYFRGHPDGPFNARIANGELVQGMGVAEVLAAWGPPGRRYARPNGRENWIYVARDRFSGDAVIYELKFETRRLQGWDTHRKTAAAGRLVSTENRSAGRGVGENDVRSGPGMNSAGVLKK